MIWLAELGNTRALEYITVAHTVRQIAILQALHNVVNLHFWLIHSKFA